MFCSKCGKPVNEGAQFCSNCGNPVNGTKPNNATAEKAKNFFNEILARADDLKGPEPVDALKAIKLFCLYALNFNGRSSRSEYWWMFLISGLASAVLSSIPIIGGLASLAILVPTVAVSIRRLHDIGKSGWYMLMGLIPVAGFIIMLIFYCQHSQPEANQWGPSAQYIDL